MFANKLLNWRVWLPALAGRMWLPLILFRIRSPHASFRLKPEATPAN
jgi:hypothetical protein